MKILSTAVHDDEIVVMVEGEEGIYYVTVDEDGIRCTCPAFKYRGTCPHVKEVEKIIDQIIA